MLRAGITKDYQFEPTEAGSGQGSVCSPVIANIYMHYVFLYGKTFCGSCGAPMTRRTLTGYRGEKYKAWECREHHLGRAGNGCKGRNIRETELMAGDACRRLDGLRCGWAA